MRRYIASERGLTLVEVLVGMVIMALVAGTSAYAWRSLAQAPNAAAQAAQGTAGSVQLFKVTDEIRSAVAFTEATPDAMTFVASTVSGAQAETHVDPATGQQVTLRRYTVRYAFQNGRLYRDTGEPPAWASLPPGAMGLPVAPEIGRPPQAPTEPFPGPRPSSVADPGPPQYSTAFSGVWLTKSGTSGLATSRVWSQGQWEDRCSPPPVDSCWHEWVVRYYAAGPLWITHARFNDIANNPQRDSAGNIVGYNVGDGVWASPAGLEHIRHHRGWVCTWPHLFGCNHWEHVHWVLGQSNELTQSEYNASKNSPMTANAVSPAWLEQRQAHQQYQHDLAVWNHRYNTWVGYYREYGQWQRQAMLNTALVGGARELGMAFSSVRRPLPAFRPQTQPTLSGNARSVGSFASIRFEYFDRQGNPTSNPADVRRVVIHYRVNNGANASTGVVIGGEAVSGTASRDVIIPRPCDIDPALCPPPPPHGDPTFREFEQETGPDAPVAMEWFGSRTDELGTIFIRCSGGVCSQITDAEFVAGATAVREGRTNGGWMAWEVGLHPGVPGGWSTGGAHRNGDSVYVPGRIW